ncbi:arginine biosynthesis protein ArgJ [Pavlovales sp. CCMP2436]|nr:arginine biosynthesis protein ArgJ [Pavlovales sp. CCMP2436]
MKAKMNLTLIALDRPTDSFAAVFTRNAFPGAPVIVGKSRMSAERIQAVVVNNKISNVCAGSPNGPVADSERVCAELATALGLGAAELVLPCSTGIIGWRLPVGEMCAALPALAAARQSESALPAATGIMTTDAYPKLRAEEVLGGRIVAFAKGAGMIEPNMATMLAYVLTDLAVPRAALREMLPRVAAVSFNCISVDGDQSTSDTLIALASGKVPMPTGAAAEAALAEVEAALTRVCTALATDIVRNGEGVRHIIDVTVTGAPTAAAARAIGKAVVNSNLFKCAVAGNDPNVGRILAAVGSCAGVVIPDAKLDNAKVSMGGRVLFADGRFQLDGDTEDALYAYFKQAEMPKHADTVGEEGFPFPPHERAVEILVELGVGSESARVLGADLTGEYVEINADYRS